MTAGSAPQDRGLAPERTALAWQRSGLAMAGVSVLVARLTITTAGVVAVLAAVSGLAHAAAVFVLQRREYRGRLAGRSAHPFAVGVHTALLAGQVVLLSAIELWHLLHRA